MNSEENGWSTHNSSSHRHLEQLEEDHSKQLESNDFTVEPLIYYPKTSLGKFSESFEELAPPPFEGGARLDEGSGYSTADDLSVELGEMGGLGAATSEQVAMESSEQLGEGEDAFDGESSDLERVSNSS